MKTFFTKIWTVISDVWTNHAQSYAISSAITFVCFFLTTAVVFINENATWETALNSGFWVGCVSIALRAATKATWDLVVTYVPKIISYLKSLNKPRQ